jgi:hypothetical protein
MQNGSFFWGKIDIAAWYTGTNDLAIVLLHS